MGNKRITELDGLRGIGCLVVLLHHAFATQIFWAWIWMEMFFVLSGFLITTILLRTDLTQPKAVRNFLIRRALRIWPVYYAGLLGAILIWAAFRWHNPAAFEGVVWWKCFVFLQFTEGYSTLDLSYLQNYAHWFRSSWSLATEEQYYILWPLLILLAGGRRSVMFAFCVTLLAACIAMRASDHALNLLFTRGDGFALGSAMAMLQAMANTRRPLFRQRLNALYSMALVGGLAVVLPYIIIGYATGAVREYDDIVRYGNWTLTVTASAALFFGLIGLMVNGHLRPVQQLVSWRPFTYVGEVSYAVYMYQTLVFVVAEQIPKLVPGVEHWAVSAGAIATSIALGPLSRRYLENPIGNLKHYFPVITRSGTTQDVITPGIAVAQESPPVSAAALAQGSLKAE